MKTPSVHLVYHGTVMAYARDIWLRGIDLTRQRPGTDFGQGFYTTTQWAQATTWADQTERWYEIRTKTPSVPAVVAFGIDLGRWIHLSGQRFSAWPDPSPSASLLVERCRETGMKAHAFDYVFGPVYSPSRGGPRLWSNPIAKQGKDQLSVHSDAAAAVLFQSIVGVWANRGGDRWSREVI
jgi:hypothetical protein